MADLQAVIDLARVPLNDDDGARYADATILRYVIHGLLKAFSTRPDLFVTSFAAPPSLSMTAESAFPLPDGYIQVIADYCTARCEAVDDEHVDSGRVAQFMQLFGGVVPL